MGAKGVMPKGWVPAVAAVAAVALAGCGEPSAPRPLESGTVEFEWVAEGETTAESWEAAGACTTRDFSSGATTCAVGLDDGARWLAFGVRRNAGDSYDTITLVYPAGEESCTASFTPGVEPTCTIEFIPGRVNFSTDPVPVYVMTSGTITVEADAGEQRLRGSFEGTAEDVSELELPPITMTAGSFDVDFADG